MTQREMGRADPQAERETGWGERAGRPEAAHEQQHRIENDDDGDRRGAEGRPEDQCDAQGGGQEDPELHEVGARGDPAAEQGAGEKPGRLLPSQHDMSQGDLRIHLAGKWVRVRMSYQ
ncbi:MAG TPA: hypothetical protein VNC14_09700 [Lapillicoccus sp.]|jgi:hypothetical protein|nr:hypothetical protein [Lapillicoccus sp.]